MTADAICMHVLRDSMVGGFGHHTVPGAKVPASGPFNHQSPQQRRIGCSGPPDHACLPRSSRSSQDLGTRQRTMAGDEMALIQIPTAARWGRLLGSGFSRWGVPISTNDMVVGLTIFIRWLRGKNLIIEGSPIGSTQRRPASPCTRHVQTCSVRTNTV